MDRIKAMEIAMDFIVKMNPDMWDGQGIKPRNFDTKICCRWKKGRNY